MLDEPCAPWPLISSCCPGWVDAQDAPNPPGDEDDEDATAAYEAALAAFDLNQAMQEQAVRWASTVLWKRGGRKIGVCTSTVRVCPPCCYCTPCSCGPRHLITLSLDRPVVSICSITSVCNSTVIDDSRYAVINNSAVALVDGTCGWLPGAPFDCGLEIVFGHGWEPDIEAMMAMSQLACEYLKWCRGENCKSDAFLKLAGVHRRGKRNVVLTGLPLVDHWLIQVGSESTSGMIDPSDLVPYGLG